VKKHLSVYLLNTSSSLGTRQPHGVTGKIMVLHINSIIAGGISVQRGERDRETERENAKM
jgi:hypothetical protein